MFSSFVVSKAVPQLQTVCVTLPKCAEQHSMLQIYVVLTIFIVHYILYTVHQIRKTVNLFLLQIWCFLLMHTYIPTEWKFLNLLWSDNVQSIEVCLTVCNPFAAICFVATRDLLTNQEE